MKLQPNNTSPSKIRRLVFVVVGGVLMTCICLIVLAVTGPSTQEPAAVVQDVSSVGAVEPTRTTRPTETSVPGTERDSPVPLGTAIDVGGGVTAAVAEVIRPADNAVRQGNMFNADPEQDEEYLAAYLKLSCSKSDGETCRFSSFEFKAVGSDGNIRDAAMVVSVEGQIEDGEFFGGSTKEGWIFFLVGKGDPDVVLIYDPILFGRSVYFSLSGATAMASDVRVDGNPPWVR